MVCYRNCFAWWAIREPVVAILDGLKALRNADAVALSDLCAISNPTRDPSEAKLCSEHVPRGNEFAGPDILPTLRH